jgi:hypothetical protein
MRKWPGRTHRYLQVAVCWWGGVEGREGILARPCLVSHLPLAALATRCLETCLLFELTVTAPAVVVRVLQVHPKPASCHPTHPTHLASPCFLWLCVFCVVLCPQSQKGSAAFTLQVPALFEFGHGLSYASFKYASFRTDPCSETTASTTASAGASAGAGGAQTASGGEKQAAIPRLSQCLRLAQFRLELMLYNVIKCCAMLFNILHKPPTPNSPPTHPPSPPIHTAREGAQNYGFVGRGRRERIPEP